MTSDAQNSATENPTTDNTEFQLAWEAAKATLEAAVADPHGENYDAAWTDAVLMVHDPDAPGQMIAEFSDIALRWLRRWKEEGNEPGPRESMIVTALLVHPNTPAQTAAALCVENLIPGMCKQAFADCETITAEHIQEAASRWGWNATLAAHPAVDASQLQELIREVDNQPEQWVQVADTLISHPNATGDQITWAWKKTLVNDPYKAVLATRHPKCPPEVRIAQRFKITDDEVRARRWNKEQLRLAAELVDGWNRGWDELVMIVETM